MEFNIARALNISPAQVNVKATTEEGLGFTGAGEGIAAHAVCLIQEDRPSGLYAREGDQAEKGSEQRES